MKKKVLKYLYLANMNFTIEPKFLLNIFYCCNDMENISIANNTHNMIHINGYYVFVKIPTIVLKNNKYEFILDPTLYIDKYVTTNKTEISQNKTFLIIRKFFGRIFICAILTFILVRIHHIF